MRGTSGMKRVLSGCALMLGIALMPSLATASLILSTGTPTLTGNSADNSAGTAGQLMRQNLSSINVSDTGGSTAAVVGNSVDAAVRYALINTIDRDNNGGGAGETKTHAWQLSFSVTAPVGNIYDLVIDTSRIGALTVRRDNGNLVGFGRADLGAMTGTLTGPGSQSGTLNLGANAPGLRGVGTTNPTFDDISFNQSTSLSSTGIIGTGAAQNFTLTFSWTTTVETTGGFSAFGTGASSHEGAVRMGMATTSWVSQIPSATYPGNGGRVIGDDGHFVNVTATLTAVPEPSSAGSVLLCLLGFAGFRRRLA